MFLENKASQRRFRRIQTDGSDVEIAFGQVASGTDVIRISVASAIEAEQVAARWGRWALADGYSEVDMPPGEPGVVHWVEGAAGWIRLDANRVAHFSEAAVPSPPPPLAIGTRVTAEGLSPYAGPGAEGAHRGKFEAERVHVVLEPGRTKKPKAVDADEGTIADLAIAEKAAPHTLPSTPGDLIFAHEKGVHRFLLIDGNGLVVYEPVFRSNGKRSSGPASRCAADFVRVVPANLARRLLELLGS